MPSTEHAQRTTVCFPFAGDSIGGSHISVEGLLRGLGHQYRAIVVPEIADGRIAQLFAANEQAADPGAMTGAFVPGEAFDLRKAARTLGGILPRVRFLRQKRVDIVHVNDGRTSANWALPARLAGARLVWHNRGDPGALGLRLVAPLLADRVVCVSEFALPGRGLWSTSNKADVIHSPFDTDVRIDRGPARAALVDELGIKQDTLILGYFGSFVARKRPLLFVDMIARLRTMLDRPVVGVMFGAARLPAMEAALHARIKDTGTTDIVRLMGYRSPGIAWIAACDQLVVPAVGEPFGRTLVEAMLVGTPVVAARSGGNIEALREGIGVLASPDDANALAECCADLARNLVSARAMAARAQDDARERFGGARHCALIGAVYDRMMRRG